MVFKKGLDMDAAVFVTDAFKEEEPGLTMILREACRRGWKPVRSADLKGRGKKPSLLLKGGGETIEGFARTQVKCLTVADVVRWVTETCLDRSRSGRVRKQTPP